MTRLYTEPHYRIAGDDWKLNEIKIYKRVGILVELTFIDNVNFNIHHFEMSIWNDTSKGDRLMWEIDRYKDDTFNTRTIYYEWLKGCVRHILREHKIKNAVDATYYFLNHITVWYSEE